MGLRLRFFVTLPLPKDGSLTPTLPSDNLSAFPNDLVVADNALSKPYAGCKKGATPEKGYATFEGRSSTPVRCAPS